MASRREQITLSEDEQRELLDSERVVVVGSHGPRGFPHLMPLWYVVRDGEIWIWTYAKSQKVKNLERDPRCTLLVEAGHEYTDLKGVQIEAEAEIVRDTPQVARVRQGAHGSLQRGDRLRRGRRGGRARVAGAEAGRDPIRPQACCKLGPLEARRHLLT